MRLDTECDVSVDAGLRPDTGLEQTIASVRDTLLAEHLGLNAEVVARETAARGSLVAAIEKLRRDSGRTLAPFVDPALHAVETWLAENEVLDPESPAEMFEKLIEARPVSRMVALLRFQRHAAP